MSQTVEFDEELLIKEMLRDVDPIRDPWCVGLLPSALAHGQVTSEPMAESTHKVSPSTSTLESQDSSNLLIKSSPAVRYMFPHGEADFELAAQEAQSLDTAGLVLALSSAAEALNEPDVTSGTMISYSAMRSRMCALAIEMNMRQIQPPTIRPWTRPAPDRFKMTAVQKLASNDLQVIDLHWLHCGGFTPPVTRWKKVFGATFNFDEASAFTRRVGKAAVKAEELGLTRQEMLLLKVVRNAVVQNRHRDIRKLLDIGKAAIRTAFTSAKSRQTCSSEEMVQTCHALLLSDFDIGRTTLVAQQVYGLQLSVPTVRRRLKWLQQHKLVHAIRTSPGAPTS